MALRVKVRRTRPRVYLSDDLAPEMLRRAETTHVEEWSQLVVWSRGIAKTPESHRLRPARLAERARRLAFLYALRRDERDVEFAMELAPHLAALPAVPQALSAASQLYDSLRAVLTERTELTLRRAILAWAKALYERDLRGSAILAPARSECIGALLAAGLTLFGEEKEAPEILGAAVHAARDLIGTLQFYAEEDGGFPLGWSESLVHFGQVPKLALLAETGLGQSWPTNVPWLERYAEFLEAGLKSAGGEDSRSNPVWIDGGATGAHLADLWRILALVASESANPSALRLLARLSVPGRQDERMLYERRPLAGPAEAEPPERERTLFYRRSGLAVFRETARAGPCVESVVRCASAGLAGRDGREAGSFSIACDAEILPGGARAPNILIVTGPAEDTETAAAEYPHTRRELNQPEYQFCEVVAFESGVGSITVAERPPRETCRSRSAIIAGGFDYLVADLTRAHKAWAESVMRTFVFLRSLPRFDRPALVVSDSVRLARPGGEAATTVHFTVRPELAEDRVRVVGFGIDEGLRLSDRVLLPAPARMWLDEPVKEAAPGPAPSESARHSRPAERLYRLRIGPREPMRAVRFCQVFFVSAAGADDDCECSTVAAEGALVLEVAGSVLVLGVGDACRVEAVTRGEVKNLAAVGLVPSARLTLEVAGEPPVKTATTEFGAAYVEVTIPRETGFVVTCERAGG